MFKRRWWSQKADMRPLIWSINNKPEEWVRQGSVAARHKDGSVFVDGRIPQVTYKEQTARGQVETTVNKKDMPFRDRVSLRLAVSYLHYVAGSDTLKQVSGKIAAAVAGEKPLEGKMYCGDVVVYEGKLPANEDDIFAYLARKRLTVGE